MKRLLYFFLFILLNKISFAQQTPISSNPELKKLVLSGLDKMYDFKFKEAEVQFKIIKTKLPKHPIYYMLMAMNYDWQWEPELNNDSLVKKIIAFLNKTVELSEDILNVQKKDDAEIMFIYFTAQGFLARVRSLQGDYLKAVQHSTNAYKFVKKGMNLKEKFTDFYFSTGMYNYYREKYPQLHPMVKPFAKFLDPGNAQEGINQLMISYKSSLFSKIESANYLINIYFKYEGKPEMVINTIEEVVTKYPNNLFFIYKLAEGYMLTNQFDKALPYINKLTGSSRSYYKCVGNILLAWHQMTSKDIANASNTIKQAELLYKKLIKVNDNLHGYFYLTKGKIYQEEGKLAEAKNYYNLAATKSEYPSTQKEAKELADKIK